MKKKYKKNRKVKHTVAFQAIAVSLAFVFLFLLCSNRIDASRINSLESLPGVSQLIQEDKPMYKFTDGVNDTPAVQPAAQDSQDAQASRNTPDNENSSLIYESDLVGVNDVNFGQDMEPVTVPSVKQDALSYGDINKLRDLSYLQSNFYTVDNRTGMTAADFNVDDMLNTNLKLDMSQPGPKVLIFHTHSQEMFSDSDPGNLMDGVVGLGEKLAQILTNNYGIETLHDTGEYDVVNGKHEILGAYERMEPVVEQILKEHPSIQVAIDIHRDGVPNNVRLVTDINGVPTAQVMFNDGLCLVNDSGKLVPYEVQNPYLKTNLAFSFQSQLIANNLYPSLTRKIYLDAYRYSTNMLPESVLVEVGAQTNTKEEAQNAMRPLAAILAQVLK